MALFSGYWRRSELMHLIHKTRQKQELPMVPCFLTDRDEKSTLCRGPSVDASYQFSVLLAKQFQRRR